MGLVGKVKHFFYHYSLKKTLKGLSAERTMLNLDDASSIAVLFNASKPENTLTVTQFANDLQSAGKKVHILGYQDSKSKEPIGEHFFDRNEVNWYGKPEGSKIDAFTRLKPDILICAFIGECLPLEYLTAISPARFRVGAFSQAKTDSYELMINVKNKTSLKYLLEQVTHFLKVINKHV